VLQPQFLLVVRDLVGESRSVRKSGGVQGADQPGVAAREDCDVGLDLVRGEPPVLLDHRLGGRPPASKLVGVRKRRGWVHQSVGESPADLR
jgi:hypothetical protein